MDLRDGASRPRCWIGRSTQRVFRSLETACQTPARHLYFCTTERTAMTGSDPALAAWVAAYVAETSREENVDAFVEHVNTRILAALPEIAPDPVLLAEMHASTKAQFQVFLSLLQRERPELLLPPQAVDLALSIARRQFELRVLLKIYRVGAEAVWDYF